MRKSYIALALCAALCLPLWGCGFRSREKLDLSSIHTTAAGSSSLSGETMSSSEETLTLPSREESVSEASSESSPSAKIAPEAAGSISVSVNTFTQGNVSIEYPLLSGMEDGQKEAAVNRLLKTNALSILDACEIDTDRDSLSVLCRITAADRRRVTAVYTGSQKGADSAYPTRLFYTNTVDLPRAADLGLSDYVDPALAAAYVLSPDCLLVSEDDGQKEELTAFKEAQTAEYYAALFSGADFPLSAPDGQAVWPESFSYELQGVIYISIPVPHALGDYALIKYIPDTK